MRKEVTAKANVTTKVLQIIKVFHFFSDLCIKLRFYILIIMESSSKIVESSPVVLLDDEETVDVQFGESTVTCSWLILRKRSEFFNTIYGLHKKGQNLILEETCPDKAVELLKELHSFKPLQLKWDIDKAKLCAKWIVLDMIEQYTQLLSTSMQGFGYYTDVDAFWGRVELMQNNAAYQYPGYRKNIARNLKYNHDLLLRDKMLQVFSPEETDLLIEVIVHN